METQEVLSLGSNVVRVRAEPSELRRDMQSAYYLQERRTDTEVIPRRTHARYVDVDGNHVSIDSQVDGGGESNTRCHVSLVEQPNERNFLSDRRVHTRESDCYEIE